MPSKTEEYLALAQRTANGLTRYWESWTDYLTTASRLYKYPFADQLMIYAQRPDATACADFDIWNNRMNRYVRRGAKGIALLDESSGFPRLHYVFDVSDTGVRRNSRDLDLWQYNDDLKQPVSEMLRKTYGISGERVSQQLADVAGKLVADYWDNNGGDIRAIVDGSLLMDYDEAGVEMQFKSAAAISVTYTLLERCGFEPTGWFDKDDFQAIYNFSTPDSVYALGAAVSDMSREVLRQIERTVKTTIRRRNAERSQYEYEQQERDLLDRRGLPAPEPDPEPTPEAAGQVRQAAPDLPEGASPGAVPHDADEREPVPASDGGGADGREPDAADHGAASEAGPSPGQSAESTDVGAAHEQPESTGRGTGADGADLQLSFLDAVLPTEAQQIEKIDRAESEKTPSAFVLSQAEIENELRRHGSGFAGGKQRIMALYQTQPDRKLRAKALAKEYGIGGHSHDFLDGSRGFVNHDWKGLEFVHYPDYQKITLKWAQVEKYIDLMIQSDRYLTDKEKEHYSPPAPVSAKPDGALTHAKNLIRDFCLEEYDSEPDFSDLSKIGIAYTHATDEDIPIQVNVDLVGYRVERYLGEVLIDERQYESLEELTETELEALDFSELVSVTDEELEHYHSKAEERPALLPLDAATEYNALKEQYPDALVGFEQNGQFEFYGEDARKVCELVGGKLLEKETELGTVPVTGFSRGQWAYRAKQLWQCGENVYLAGLNEDGTHHQTKYLRREDYLPLGATIHMEGRAFRVDNVNFDKDSVTLQDVALAEMRMPIFREEPLALVRELYEQEQDDRQLSDEELDALPISAVVDGEVQTFPDAAALDEALNAVPAGNFHITDDHLGEGGAKQKYARNIEAIRTLFKLEQEHRGATAEEQQVLSQYVGWGGLADAFDPGKDSWAKEYAELKGLLSEDEYAAARSSTLNAHYTSPTVIRGIYDAVERMGFRSGNILEPSMGVGNFFGMLPDTMQDSRLYGVELDSITGRIAKMLYPQADITVAGFETTDRRDFYDLAVGNVPFGQYKVNDKAYNKLGFSIHNYFFAKAIDQVRPGGVVAFVTSRYTMDSKDSTARKHMAERADLLGAIRLPNNAFRANAGTDVVSDIIFLQKRDRPADIEPAWVQLGKTEDGFAINQYFVDHPEMVLGQLTTESTQYGREELTVAPIEGANLADQLTEAVRHIEGQYTAAEVDAPDIAEEETTRRTLPADPEVKNFSYTVVDGEVFYRENSVMTQVELSDTAKGRVTGMVELRQIVNELIEQQLNDFPDEDIQTTQAKLNAAYDAFTAKYGLLNDRKNGRLFEQDSSYYLLCSLENLDEQGQLKSKAAMFTKRTIRPERTVTSVDTPSEALAVSIGEHGKVDLPYMAELLGTPGEYGRITTELSGVIFKDPAADPTDPEAGWQMADEYLSGDVRAKLRMAQFAAETNPEFSVNVEALTRAQPRELEASEIDVRLGATWLDPSIIQKFMTETFQIPYYLRRAVNVRYSPYTAEWRVEGKTATGRSDIISSETYGTSRANAYKILEETLNLKDVRIYDTIEDAEGKPKRVLNKRETMLAQQKQQIIKDAFANWVWQDPQRRIALVKQYNELFNSTRPREYDGSHIKFVGMNPEITLREHQRNAIAHVLYGGNTLLAHEVGAGKTYEMAASAMEAKRLGLCQKSLFVVPNHLTEQWASEFLNLYPNAKLLVARRKDFETANRKKFCARIATGDYDAVIIGHSQFERIPLSFERQERIIQEQIYETLAAINELKVHAGENFSIKQMEKTRKTLETKLEKLRSDERKDDVVTFEQLGVDRLFVDESHAFKNLFLTTKMRNVAGLSTSEAQKSSDMFGKCRYLDEITGGRGVVFATGTPVSNSMTELYTVMRYLQYGTLQQKKLTHFDCWASTFGETTTAIELAPEGYALIGR
jgi:N12 class adenine-specific DNA methylase/adenine-specific DNA methylase